MLEKFVGESAVLLAIGTGLFYSAGLAYFGGYAGRFGLDINVMERSIPLTIYQGMLQMLVPIETVLGGLFLLRQLWLLKLRAQKATPPASQAQSKVQATAPKASGGQTTP